MAVNTNDLLNVIYFILQFPKWLAMSGITKHNKTISTRKYEERGRNNQLKNFRYAQTIINFHPIRLLFLHTQCNCAISVIKYRIDFQDWRALQLPCCLGSDFSVPSYCILTICFNVAYRFCHYHLWQGDVPCLLYIQFMYIYICI